MRLWIDDFRAPPDDTWTWAKTLSEAMYFYVNNRDVSVIAFDHDLGGLIDFAHPLPENQTSMPLAKLIEAHAAFGAKPPSWSVHSMNPVGKANLIATLESADRLYAKSQE